MATCGGAQDMIGPAARAAGVSTVSGKYAALAESLGAHGIEVRSSPELLHRALNEAQIWPGPPSVGRAAVAAAVALTDVNSLIDSYRHG